MKKNEKLSKKFLVLKRNIVLKTDCFQLFNKLFKNEISKNFENRKTFLDEDIKYKKGSRSIIGSASNL